MDVLARTWIGTATLTAALGVAVAGDAPPAPSAPLEVKSAAYAHLMRAVLAARRGEFGAASTEIQHAVDANPGSPELLVEAARLLAWTGRATQGERLARKALELEPDDTEALEFLGDFLLARALGGNGDEAARAEALTVFEKLARSEAADPEVLMRLVQLRHGAGDLPGAVAIARRVVEARPGDSTAARTLAQLLLQNGDEEQALRVLLTHLATHPAAEDIALFAEQLTHNLEAWPVVVQILGAAEPFPLAAPVALRLLGESELRVGRTTEAAETLERAQRADPHDLRVQNHLALAYRGSGRMADTVALLGEMVRLSPDFPSFRQLLGETLELQGDTSGALEAYRAALERWGDEPDAIPVRDAIRHRVALLCLSRSDFAAARAALEDVEDADSVLSVRIRGRIAIESKDWGEARHAARRLATLGEEGLAALLEGEALARQGRWSKAESKLAEAIGRLGPVLRRRVAEIYRTEGRPEKGVTVLRDWVGADPDSADARFLLGEYLYLIDRFDEAEPELREAFRLEPQHAAAMNFLGYSYAERSTRLDEALELVQRALAIDSWNGAYLDSLGWVYYQMGRYDEARGPLERAAREMPKDPTILEHLGDLYSRLGERGAAIDAWHRALAAGPDDPGGVQRKLDAELPSSGVGDDPARASDHDEPVDPGSDTSSLLPPL